MIELQTVSNFSFLRGASSPEELVMQAAALGYPAIAIADYHTLAGIVRAHTAAKQAGIRLLSACRIPLYQEIPEKTVKSDKSRKLEDPLEALPHQLPYQRLPYSLLLYPVNRSGYANMSTLLTLGKRRALKGQCLLTPADLQEHHRALFATVLIHSFYHPQLISQLKQLKQIFDAERLSISCSRTYGPDDHNHLQLLEQLSKMERIPLVASNDVHYHCRERRMLQDVLSCIRRGCTLQEAGLALFQNAERHLKPPEEMRRLFRRLPQAIARSSEIAQAAAGFSLDELRYQYPHEICPEGKSPQQYLSELSWQGAAERYPKGVPGSVIRQIQHELLLIEELDYAKYFLTVYDIVRFARSQQILCQGRGAAANSAVCYVLGITAVDPDRINLLFERFISKERNEPPDIDIDFEHERREEVIQYIYQRYGRHRAALTAAVITYRSRSAIRDVGKTFALSTEEIEQLIKLRNRSEGELFPEHFRARGLDPNNKDLQQTLSLAEVLYGFPRHLSQHVGGFIISEQPLHEIVPIENAAMADRTVIEWDKDDIEQMGMLKIDVLGLGMLTCIRKALAFLNERRAAEDRIELHSVPPEDPAVYHMACRADTIGVFQIESRAQMSMLPRLRPQCFYDLVVEVAIVRPGPIQGGMVHPYLKRRNGEEAVSYPNEAVKKILEPTLGVPIFQEQVMELAVVAAGFSPGEADQLRRAMASWKRSKNKLMAFRERLLGGMLQRGYTHAFAEQVFQQIQGFGEYGFPQSHSASFALLVYVSAWLKCRHPAVFAAALLNSQPMGFYRPAQIIDDAKRHGVPVLPIDVNHSGWDCRLEWNSTALDSHSENGTIQTTAKPPALRLGMRLVRGLQQTEANTVASAVTTHGSFDSLSKLWRLSGVRAASLKLLARADAFTSMQLSRQQALWAVRKLRDERLPLFEQIPEQQESQSAAALPPFSAKQHVIHDYRLTGLSLKAHPMSFLRKLLHPRGVMTCYELRQDPPCSHGVRIAAAGLVLVRQRPMTASGVVFMTIEDETGTANIIVRPKIFELFRDTVCDAAFLLAAGRIQREGEVIHLLLESAEDLTATFHEIGSQSRDFH